MAVATQVHAFLFVTTVVDKATVVQPGDQIVAVGAVDVRGWRWGDAQILYHGLVGSRHEAPVVTVGLPIRSTSTLGRHISFVERLAKAQ